MLSEALVHARLLRALIDVLMALVAASRAAYWHEPGRSHRLQPRLRCFVLDEWVRIRAKTLGSLGILKQCKLVVHACYMLVAPSAGMLMAGL